MSSTTIFRAPFLVYAFALIVALSGCGGGGGASANNGGGSSVGGEDMDGSGPSVGTYTEFAATTAGATSTLRTVAIDNAQANATPITVTLVHQDGTLQGGVLAGVLDAARTEITLDGGGTVALTNPVATEYVRFFQTSGFGNDLFGVIGQVADSQDLPADGTATYNGVVQMEVTNSNGGYVLTGDAQIIANWSNDIDTMFQNFSGSLNGGPNQTFSGTIGMLDAPISNAAFSGGTLTRTGTLFATTAPITTDFVGQFYGKNADEVGGIFVLNSADLNVSAVFAAE